MFHVVLYEPEIPQNTGNIIRLCANTGSTLHLIHPLGFRLEDRYLRRAGLDYHQLATVQEHQGLDRFIEEVCPQRVFACTTRGNRAYTEEEFRPGDAFLFGSETRGLPQAILDRMPREQWLRIPMRPGNRSLNLANAVTVLLFEGWRQHGFEGAALV